MYYRYDNRLKRIAFVFKQDKVVYSFPFISPVETISEIPDPFDALEDDLKTYIVDPSLIEKATALKFTPAVNYFEENTDFQSNLPDFQPKIAVFNKAELRKYL